MLVIQHSSGLEDLQILVANVLDGGNDPKFGYGCDLVGGSREVNLKIIGDVNCGLSVDTDGRKTESDKRQRTHGDVEKGSSNWIETRCASASQHPILFIPLGIRETRPQKCSKTREKVLTGTKWLMVVIRVILSVIVPGNAGSCEEERTEG